jgi:hypothetical protein
MTVLNDMMTLRVCVQFPRPDDISIVTRRCPHCEAPNGRRCKTRSGSWCGFHMARILDALGYGRVGGREVYAWKTGPFAKELK